MQPAPRSQRPAPGPWGLRRTGFSTPRRDVPGAARLAEMRLAAGHVDGALAAIRQQDGRVHLALARLARWDDEPLASADGVQLGVSARLPVEDTDITTRTAVADGARRALLVGIDTYDEESGFAALAYARGDALRSLARRLYGREQQPVTLPPRVLIEQR